MVIFPVGDSLPFGIKVTIPSQFEEKAIDRYGNVYRKNDLGLWYLTKEA